MTELDIANISIVCNANIEESLHNRAICAGLQTAELYIVQQNEKSLRSVIPRVIISYPEV